MFIMIIVSLLCCVCKKDSKSVSKDLLHPWIRKWCGVEESLMADDNPGKNIDGVRNGEANEAYESYAPVDTYM